MRIAFIGQKGIPTLSGGVEKHVEALAIRMAKMGHEVFVYVRNNYTDKNLHNYKGVKLIHLPSISTKHLDAISHTFLATMHALFRNYDVVHYHAIGPTSLSWIIKLLKRRTALIATFHCQDYYHQKWGKFARTYLHLGEYVTCKVPDKTIVVSKVLRDFTWNEYKTNSIFIPNGAAINYRPETNLLNQWNLRDKRYILFVGRLIKHKGIHYLVEAFKRMEDTNRLPNNFKLVIVGDGFHTDEYVKYLNTIKEGRKNIIFTGSQSGEVLEQLFSHAYLYVQPSESEGLSIAVLEAMGYGIPPLVSDINENLEAIGNAGFSFEMKNVEDLKDKLAHLLNRPVELQHTGKRAKERAEREYSWESIARKTIDVYREALSRKKQQIYVWKPRKI